MYREKQASIRQVTERCLWITLIGTQSHSGLNMYGSSTHRKVKGDSETGTGNSVSSCWNGFQEHLFSRNTRWDSNSVATSDKLVSGFEGGRKSYELTFFTTSSR
jgi:hypothetical protein